MNAASHHVSDKGKTALHQDLASLHHRNIAASSPADKDCVVLRRKREYLNNRFRSVGKSRNLEVVVEEIQEQEFVLLPAPDTVGGVERALPVVL